MASEIPRVVRIECCAASEPLGSAWVMVTLPMESKNPYRLLFGPSDDWGVVEIDRDELLATARREQELALMDYTAFPGGWTGEIQAKVLGLRDIARLRAAIETWGLDAYPPDFELHLSKYEAQLRDLGDAALSVQIVTR